MKYVVDEETLNQLANTHSLYEVGIIVENMKLHNKHTVPTLPKNSGEKDGARGELISGLKRIYAWLNWEITKEEYDRSSRISDALHDVEAALDELGVSTEDAQFKIW